jgi:hypothetical protein
MRALVETLPVRAGDDLTLLYRARNAKRLLFRDELDDIARRRSARVHSLLGDDRSCLTAPGLQWLVPRLTRATSTSAGLQGWPTRAGRLCAPPCLQNAVHEECFAW